jgi:hypothetical protein
MILCSSSAVPLQNDRTGTAWQQTSCIGTGKEQERNSTASPNPPNTTPGRARWHGAGRSELVHCSYVHMLWCNYLRRVHNLWKECATFAAALARGSRETQLDNFSEGRLDGANQESEDL